MPTNLQRIYAGVYIGCMQGWFHGSQANSSVWFHAVAALLAHSNKFLLNRSFSRNFRYHTARGMVLRELIYQNNKDFEPNASRLKRGVKKKCFKIKISNRKYGSVALSEHAANILFQCMYIL